MRLVVLCAAAVLAPTSALVCRDTGALTRRGLLKQTVAAAAPLLTLGAAPVWADTQPELAEQSSKSIDNEQKRAAFKAAQKVYKKAWRKELANLEYASTDEERIEAVRAMLIMIQKNSGDIPEGVRRQDLDQIYKRIKAGMDKQARMAFLQLDDVVRNAERVKNMAEDDGL